MTRVSIVTISFNQVEFLERTILSVLNQDYPEIEYIIVDPGSIDGSREIIERYRSRIAKIVYQPDKGAADGLNHGFAEATGSVYAYLNSDDLLLPGAVSSAVRFLHEHKDIAVVSGHGNLIDPQDRFLRRLFSDEMSISRSLYGGATLIQPSTFFRREIYNQAGGFSVANKICWDSELFLEMAQDVQPEFRQADILRRRELLADAAAAACGAAIGIAGVALDQRDRPLEALLPEEIGGTAAHDPATDDHNIIRLHGAALCPKTNILSSLSCRGQAWQI